MLETDATHARNIPGVAWLLVVAATIHLLVIAVSRALLNSSAIDWGALVSVLSGATPFLVAAAVVIGAARWPIGRWSLAAAAILFAVRGVLDLGLDTWLIWWQSNPVEFDTPTTNVILSARSLTAAALTVVAPILLAIGLWMDRTNVPELDRRRRGVMGALAILGLIASAGGLVLAVIQGTSPLVQIPGSDLAWNLLTALEPAAYAALAIAGVRVLPTREVSPEAVIGAGGTLVVLSEAWLAWLFSQRQLQDIPLEWIGWLVNLPYAIALVGTVGVVAGFTLAGLRKPQH